MRIIGGTLKGRVLKTPVGYETTRPTADRAKEGLFNILSARLASNGKTWTQTVFFDGFAGSGAMGIEALSRGASHVFFVEKDKKALACLKENLQGLPAFSFTLFNDDILRLPEKTNDLPFPDILFLDAPYGKGLWEKALVALVQKNWITPKTICICETEKKFQTPFLPDFELLEERSYGRPVFLFFRLKK
jgi:16S rRNA (guanine966-N2)-methyltransferase